MVSGLRVVFFGTPRFAVPTLEALIASPHEVVGVVTQPDRPRGRGQKVTAAPVKAAAASAMAASRAARVAAGTRVDGGARRLASRPRASSRPTGS